MPNHIETELKLGCSDESVWEEIMSAEALVSVIVSGSENIQQLEARYFDTPSHALQKAQLAYRLRREGENWIATVKGGGSSKGGLHARLEWNVVVSSNEPDIGVFAHTEIGERLQEVIGDEIVEPILITFFERRMVDVVMPDSSTIEVAADKGAIIAGEKTAPILEIELELKAGDPKTLFMLGAALSRELPLLPESDSKFYRGLLLAGLSTVQQKKNPVPQVGTAKPVSEAISELLIDLIHHILTAQRAFLENPQLPELVHELRIGLRRLRSVMEFAEPLNVIKQYTWYQDELKKISQRLAALRELDVAYASWRQLQEHQSEERGSKVWLGDVLAESRNQEMEKIVSEFNFGLTTPVLLGLWGELLDNEWPGSIVSDSTAEKFVSNGLVNWIKKVRNGAESVVWSDVSDVHNFRLGIKKLRYVVEVMQPLLGDRASIEEQLEKLQDTLGNITDVRSTELLLKDLLRSKSSRAVHLEAGMLMGWQMREQLLLQKKANKNWKKFNRAAKKWK